MLIPYDKRLGNEWGTKRYNVTTWSAVTYGDDSNESCAIHSIAHRQYLEPSTPAMTFMEILLKYSRLDCDLQDAIEPFAKYAIPIPNVVERKSMGKQWRQVHTSMSDHLH